MLMLIQVLSYLGACFRVIEPQISDYPGLSTLLPTFPFSLFLKNLERKFESRNIYIKMFCIERLFPYLGLAVHSPLKKQNKKSNRKMNPLKYKGHISKHM